MSNSIPSRLIQQLRSAQRVVVLTGAGISAESGIPTFRDPLTGLWAQYDATELATPDAFRRDPDLVWGWYEWRRRLIRRAVPNSGHHSLARIESRAPACTLITQNVDDLHERAGSRQPVHLHGEISRPYCESCLTPFELPVETSRSPVDGQRETPPSCRACGGRVRPGVVCFGESLPPAAWKSAMEATQRCDMFLCIGTSAVVQPAASLIDIARHAGACTVQINPTPTPADAGFDFAIRGGAGVMLPDLLNLTWPAPVD